MSEEVLFKPHKKQIEFIEAVFSDEYSFILFGGAVRGGKTYALLGTAIMLCKLYEGSRYVVIRKDLPRIKINVLPVFYQICPTDFIKVKPTQHNQWIATFTNGSQIIFFPENYEQDKELNRFKGLEADGFFFDEMDVTVHSFYKAFERKGSWQMKQRQETLAAGGDIPPQIVAGTCNPIHNWVKLLIYDKYAADKLPEGWMYIPSKVWDNPYVSEEWIEDKRRNMTAVDFKRFVEGDWNININDHPFFYEFSRSRHLSTTSISMVPTEPLYISFDFNINPTTAVISQIIYGEGIRIYKVIQLKGGTEALCRELLQYEGYMLKITGDCSGNAGSTAAGMAGGQYNTDFNIIKKVLSVSDHQLIGTQGANKLHTYSRGLCNAVLHRIPLQINAEGCEALITDLETGQPKPNGTLLKDRGSHKQDAGDAFRYLINAYFLNGMADVVKFESLLLR